MTLIDRIKAAWAALNGYHLQEWTPDRQTFIRSYTDARHALPYGVRKRMLDWSREMEKRDPLFNRFLGLCEQYVVGPNGLRIESASANKDFANAANDEWENWCPYADIASRQSFGQRQGLIERECEVAGGVFIYLTYGASNRPRIQLFESEKCLTPPNLKDDKSVFDGIRSEPNGRSIEYFFKTGDGADDFTPRPAESVIHMFDPSMVGQVRELPVIYPVLKDMLDTGELQDLEMIAAKDASETSKVVSTATGKVDAAGMRRQAVQVATQTPDGTSTTVTKAQYYKDAIGAKTKVIQNGDKYEQFQSNRPSVAMQTFWDFIQSRNAAGLGLPIEIMIMRSLQGTMARGAFDMAANFFRCRAATRAESFGRIWEHVIGNSPSPALRRMTQKGGVPDWRKTRYTTPRSINVDVGRNSAAMLAELGMAATNWDLIYGPLGLSWKTEIDKWLEQRAYIFAQETALGLPHIQIGEQAPPIDPAQMINLSRGHAFNRLLQTTNEP